MDATSNGISAPEIALRHRPADDADRCGMLIVLVGKRAAAGHPIPINPKYPVDAVFVWTVGTREIESDSCRRW